MADLTAAIQRPTLAGQNLNFTPVSAEDTFFAQPNAAYLLLYFNNTTPSTGPHKVVDQVTPKPAGSTVADGFADVIIDADGLGTGVTQFSAIPNSNRFRDSNGMVHLVHEGAITDLSVAILGPLPAF